MQWHKYDALIISVTVGFAGQRLFERARLNVVAIDLLLVTLLIGLLRQMLRPVWKWVPALTVTAVITATFDF
jgi:hypothetical protein